MGNGTHEEAKALVDKYTFDTRTRRIEKSVEVTLNVGNMQFIKFRNTVSEDVQYTNEEFRDAYARVMQHDLAVDLRRDMVATLVDLGKTTEADREFFELCKEKIRRGTPPSASGKSSETQEGKETKQ
jgi:hypothetical protein